MKAEFLDRERTVKSLREAAGRLKRSDPRVQQVILFGSLVKGDYVPGSDADLLLVLETDARPLIERVPEFLRWFLEVPVDVEVFPYTRREIARGRADRGSFIYSVMAGPIEILA